MKNSIEILEDSLKNLKENKIKEIGNKNAVKWYDTRIKEFEDAIKLLKESKYENR